MASHYRPIGYSDFKSWMDAISFTQVAVTQAQEYAFERVINCKTTEDRPDRFKVQIMSSVDMQTGVTREVGADAIRVLLLDTQPATVHKKEKIVASWTVNRTQGAHDNVVKRAREAWGYVSLHPEHHCTCGSLKREIKGKRGNFLGCMAYPNCPATKQP